MSQTWYNSRGEDFDMNYSSGDWLNRVTFGLSDKVGLKDHIEISDTKLIARLIQNRLAPDINIANEKAKFMGEQEYDLEEYDFCLKIGEFFDNSGGVWSADAWEEEKERRRVKRIDIHGTEIEEDSR
jgi:hypothetical protein